jgi:hypothetical protein
VKIVWLKNCPKIIWQKKKVEFMYFWQMMALFDAQGAVELGKFVIQNDLIVKISLNSEPL